MKAALAGVTLFLLALETVANAQSANGTYGPKLEPQAMGSKYNPLLWQGEDAKFAVDTIHSSYCTSEISKFVAANTANKAVQNMAFTAAYDQERIFKSLRSMAKTLDFPMPAKHALEDCPATARMKELTGHELDTSYLSFLSEASATDVSRFESELEMTRGPSNWTLWGFAQKTLPALRADAASVENLQISVAKSKAAHQ